MFQVLLPSVLLKSSNPQEWSWSSLIFLQYLITGVLLLILLKCFYNIYLHPLASFPGPTYLVASEIPFSILSLRGISHHVVRKAHDKYGGIVRISPTTLSFNEGSAWNDIYGYRKGQPAVARDPLFYNEMLLDKDSIIAKSDKEAMPIRRAINAGFAPNVLQEQEPMIQRYTKWMLSEMEAKNEKHGSVDVKSWFGFAMFDIASDFVFGDSLGCLDKGAYHEWAKLVLDYFWVVPLVHQCHRLWPLNKVLAALAPPSSTRLKERHYQASIDRMRRRAALPTERRDFSHYFLRQAKQEQLSDRIVEAQGAIVVLAASESTASALTAAVYHIADNSEVYERLRHDIRSTFEKPEDITVKRILSELPYLEAVIKESLRLAAPSAGGLPRLVKAGDGVMISGRRVPRNTHVVVHQYCAHTSERNFRQADSFIPDRWLSIGPEYEKDVKSASQPFSVGPRDCPGKRFALNSINIMLTQLIWQYDFDIAPKSKSWAVDQKMLATFVQPPLHIRLQERLGK